MQRSRGELRDCDALAGRARDKIGSVKEQLDKSLSQNERYDVIGEAHGSPRVLEHNGHEISIKTHYEIVVDGETLDLHVAVDAAGRVHAHGLPNYLFSSVVELVQSLLDASDCEPPLPEDELAHIYEADADGPDGGHHGDA